MAATAQPRQGNSLVNLQDLLRYSVRTKGHVRHAATRLSDVKASCRRYQRGLEKIQQGVALLSSGLADIQDVGTHHVNANPGHEDVTACLTQAIDQISDMRCRFDVLGESFVKTVASEVTHLETRLQQDIIDLKAETQRLQKDFCDELQRYAKLSQKKNSERNRYDVNVTAHATRKEWHHALVQFAIQINTWNAQVPSLFHKSYGLVLQILHQFFKHDGSSVVERDGSSEPKFAALLQELEAQTMLEQLAAEHLRSQQDEEFQNLQSSLDTEYFLDVDNNDPFLEIPEGPQPPVLKSECLEGYVLWRQNRKVRGIGTARYVLVHLVCSDGELTMTDFETGQLTSTLCAHIEKKMLSTSNHFIDYVAICTVLSVKIASPNVKKPLVLQAQNSKMLKAWITVINTQSRNSKAPSASSTGATSVLFRPDRPPLHVNASEDEDEFEDDLDDPSVEWQSTNTGGLQLTLSASLAPNDDPAPSDLLTEEEFDRDVSLIDLKSPTNTVSFSSTTTVRPNSRDNPFS